LRELALGDLSLADGVVVVVISRWEDVDICVAVIAIVTTILTKWPSKDGGSESENGESGGS